MISKIFCSAVMVGLLSSASAFAEEHVVKAVITNWEPMITYAKPGDTINGINYLKTGKGGRACV